MSIVRCKACSERLDPYNNLPFVGPCGHSLCSRCVDTEDVCCQEFTRRSSPNFWAPRNRLLIEKMKEDESKRVDDELMKQRNAYLREERARLERELEKQRTYYEEKIGFLKQNAELKEKVYQLTKELDKKNENDF